MEREVRGREVPPNGSKTCEAVWPRAGSVGSGIHPPSIVTEGNPPRGSRGAALSPADVAQPTLDALGRRAMVLPGFLSKLLVYSTSMLPRNLRVRIMGNVMYGMTKHQQVVQQPGGSDA